MLIYGLRIYHVVIPVVVQSSNLSNNDPGLYLDGWPLCHSRCYKLGCNDGVMDDGSDTETGKKGSNSYHISYKTMAHSFPMIPGIMRS